MKLVATIWPVDIEELSESAGPCSVVKNSKSSKSDGPANTSTPDEDQVQAEWIRRVASERCRESYRSLFEYYSSRLYNYGLANQLDQAQAQELVQDVLTTVWTKAALFDESKGRVMTWIYTVARNRRFDMLRARSKDAVVLHAEDVFGEVDSLNNQADERSDPDADQFRRDIAGHVEQLVDEQREVITQVYLLGFTQEEYSKKHGIPLGTVKSRIRLALRKLDSLLERV